MDLYIVGLTTRGTARLACNWLASIQRTGQDDRTRLFCLDPAAVEVCSQFVIETDCAAEVIPLSSGNELPLEAIDYGTRTFVRVALSKLELFRKLSPSDPSMHFTPWLYTDIDAVFLDDPTEYITAIDLLCPETPLWFQSDRADFELQLSTLAQNYCMGCVYSPVAQRDFWNLCFEWLAQKFPSLPERTASGFVSDQACVNALLSPRVAPFKPGVLNPRLWLNGGRPWPAMDQGCVTEPGFPQPIFIHANYIVGAANKEARLRGEGLWFVSDETCRKVGLL